MTTILIAADLTNDAVQELSLYGNLEYIMEESTVIVDKDIMVESLRLLDPEILIVEATTIDEQLLQFAKSLKLIHCTRGNPVNIDLKACKRRGILVGNSPARNANAVSEFTFGLMIDITRKISLANQKLHCGEFLSSESWKKKRSEPVDDIIWNSPELLYIPYLEFQAPELAGKTLGLIGLGAIGRDIAYKARAFNMEVLAYDPYIKEFQSDFINLVSLDQLASQSDIVSIHAKETPETTHMINREFITKMKSQSFLINTSRGKLIDRFALIEAIESAHLAGAALDVFDYEPLSKDDPLLTYDNILLTPHIGGASRDVVRHHSDATLKNIRSYFEGEKLPFLCL